MVAVSEALMKYKPTNGNSKQGREHIADEQLVMVEALMSRCCGRRRAEDGLGCARGV